MTTLKLYRTAQQRVPVAAVPDSAAIRGRMKATWEDGDYAGFATYMEPGAIEILRGWQIPAGCMLLDIGCGAGQSAIPAARMGMAVTGIDIAANLIETARQRARDEALTARFEVGDAEALPCEDNTFDAVISQIGAMFAPDPDQVASEIARVCRPGGHLHMANWTPGSFAATMFRCVAQYAPPPAGVPSPVLWGVEETVKQRLGDSFTAFRLKRQYYPKWRYPFAPADLVGFFRQRFGPVKRAFDLQDAAGRAALHKDLLAIFESFNVATDGTTHIRGEFLNVSARRKPVVFAASQ